MQHEGGRTRSHFLKNTLHSSNPQPFFTKQKISLPFARKVIRKYVYLWPQNLQHTKLRSALAVSGDISIFVTCNHANCTDMTVLGAAVFSNCLPATCGNFSDTDVKWAA
jgi:hypothetical protein